MRNPRDFFKPLAIGAPDPLPEIPVKPSRMIHFLHFSNEKMVAKAADIATPGDLLAEARERPGRVGALYDSLARERARRFGKDRQVGIEPDPTQPANAER